MAGEVPVFLLKIKMTDHLHPMDYPITITAPRSMSRLYWLALGTFAIGTEGFMIAPLLPDLAGDFSVSVTTAGSWSRYSRSPTR